MIGDREIEQVIFRALAALNAERPPEDQIEVSLETPLFGRESRIDSLGLVSLVVDVELVLSTEHGMEVSLTDDRALTRQVSPFASVATLRDYVRELAQGA
jgi:acyl carrier protein